MATVQEQALYKTRAKKIGGFISVATAAAAGFVGVVALHIVFPGMSFVLLSLFGGSLALVQGKVFWSDVRDACTTVFNHGLAGISKSIDEHLQLEMAINALEKLRKSRKATDYKLFKELFNRLISDAEQTQTVNQVRGRVDSEGTVTEDITIDADGNFKEELDDFSEEERNFLKKRLKNWINKRNTEAAKLDKNFQDKNIFCFFDPVKAAELEKTFEKKRRWYTVAGAFSIGSGIAASALVFTSMLKIAGYIGIAAGGPYTLAGVFAVFALVAYTMQMYKTLTSHVTKNIFNEIKKSFIKAFKPEKNWTVGHVLQCILKGSIVGFLLGISIISTIASAGTFLQANQQMFTLFFKGYELASLVVSHGLIWSSKLLTDLVFSLEHSVGALEKFGEKLLIWANGFAKFCKNPGSTLSTAWKKFSFYYDFLLPAAFLLHLVGEGAVTAEDTAMGDDSTLQGDKISQALSDAPDRIAEGLNLDSTKLACFCGGAGELEEADFMTRPSTVHINAMLGTVPAAPAVPIAPQASMVTPPTPQNAPSLPSSELNAAPAAYDRKP